METNTDATMQELEAEELQKATGGAGFGFGWSKPEKIGTAAGAVVGATVVGTGVGVARKVQKKGNPAAGAAPAAGVGLVGGAAEGYLAGSVIKRRAMRAAEAARPLLS